MNAEEYTKLAIEAQKALKENGYDYRVEVTTITHPIFKHDKNRFGIMYTVLVGTVGMAEFYEQAMKSLEGREAIAKWMKGHGVKGKVITCTPEPYTTRFAKTWTKTLESQGLLLDGNAASFAFAISLYEDPVLKYEDDKDLFDSLAENYFGENLDRSIEFVKEAFR